MPERRTSLARNAGDVRFIAGTFSEISHPEAERTIAERSIAVKSFLYFVTCFLRENECWIFYYHPISFVKTKETEQSLRSAPSGRNSEQGLAPRSKYSRLYAAEYFGHRKSWLSPQVTEGLSPCPFSFGRIISAIRSKGRIFYFIMVTFLFSPFIMASQRGLIARSLSTIPGRFSRI